MNWLFYALTAMLIQGIVIFFVKMLSASYNPVFLLFMQYLGGLISAAVLVIAKKWRLKIKRKEIILVLISGFMISTGLSFYYTAIKMAPVSIVSPLQSIGIVLMQGVFGFLFLKEKISTKTILGFMCAILCIIFLTI